MVFPQTEKKEGNDCREYEELRFAGHFDFGLPPKELRGEEKGKYGPENQRTDGYAEVPNVRGIKNGGLKTLDKIGCGQE